MRRSAVLSVILAAGSAACDARERVPSVTPAQVLSDAAAVQVEAVPSTGPVPLVGWVRAVNQYGAAVASNPQSVSVGDVPSLVSFDGVGYGGVTIDSVGVTEVSAGSSLVQMNGLASWYEPPGLVPSAAAPLAGVEEVVGVTTGALAIDGNDVWWVDHEGLRPHKVLSLSEPVLGLRAGEVDVDGFDDAIAWTSKTVFLLRGRNGGGMSWGGGFTAPGYTVGGADIGDLSGDNLPDVAIAWAGGDDGGVFDVWNGDGLFGFIAAEPRLLGGIPIDVAVGDNTAEGRQQGTVLLANGTWRRFIEGAPSRYMPIGPDTPLNVLLPPGASMGPAIDLDGDGADEIHVVGPRTPGQLRQVHLFDIDDGILILSFDNEQAAYVAAGDGDGDLIDDLWLLQETGQLQALSNQGRGATATYPRMNLLSDLQDLGPIAVDDIDEDGANDFFLASEGVWSWTRGRVFRGDETRFWEPRKPSESFLREALVPPARHVTLDGDPATEEFLAFHEDAGRLQFLVLEDVGGDRSERVGYAFLDDGGSPRDLVVCDRRAYALLDSALVSIDLSDRTFPIVSATLPIAQPRGVTCGVGPAGAAVGVLDGETVLLLGPTLGELSRTTAAGAYGLTFGDVGAGPEVKVCGSPGCAIAPWRLGDGVTRYIVAEDSGVRSVAPDGTFAVIGGRADTLTFADIDLDGVTELVTHDAASGVIGLYRDLGVAVSPPQLWHNPIAWEGGVLVFDGDRDGVPDFAGIDTDSGSLRFLVPDPPEGSTSTPTTATGPTADTGVGTAAGTGSTADTGAR